MDEPTPSEIRQLLAHVEVNIVVRCNARGGRRAQGRLVAVLRCLYRRAVDNGLIKEADTPARKWPSRTACHPPGRRCGMPGWRGSTRLPRPGW